MTKEIESINKNQEKMKNTIFEIKNTLEGITSRLDEEEERTSKVKDKIKTNTRVTK